MLLDVCVYDGESGLMIKQNTCINDVVIARSEMVKMVRLNVSCDEDRINEYYADGIIVSTPTGSTAYSLSAGGPVVDPRIESIVLTPICTHSLFARSIIFSSDSEVCVEVPQDETQEIAVSCDGDESLIIGAKSRIIIRKSESFANFIRIKNDSFIDVLNSKLAQRRM
jgi:NAD+ kinase